MASQIIGKLLWVAVPVTVVCLLCGSCGKNTLRSYSFTGTVVKKRFVPAASDGDGGWQRARLVLILEKDGKSMTFVEKDRGDLAIAHDTMIDLGDTVRVDWKDSSPPSAVVTFDIWISRKGYSIKVVKKGEVEQNAEIRLDR